MLLLHIQQTSKKMDNKFSGGHYNLKNGKSDEENRVPSSKKDDPSSIKDSLDDKDQVRNTQSYIEKEENVAENVEGVHNTEGGNGFHIHQKQDENDNSFDIDSKSLTSNASHNDDEDNHGKGEYDINELNHPSLEPSTAEDLVDDWERLHDTRLPRQARDFALKVAAIHLDKDDDSEGGVTVSDIRVLLGCRSINAAEARKDRAVSMGLLVPHATLKEGKQKMYFLSNYIHVVDEKLKSRSKNSSVSPDDITLVLIKVLSSRKCAYHHIS